MNVWQQLKDKQAAEFSQFPIQYAFNNEQLREALLKLEATLDECIGTGSGGIIRRSDKEAFLALFKKHDAEREAALADDEFLRIALEYELANHEYCITGDPEDACDALGIEVDDPRTQAALSYILHWGDE